MTNSVRSTAAVAFCSLSTSGLGAVYIKVNRSQHNSATLRSWLIAYVMARRVGNREGRESGGVVTGNAHINKVKAFTEEKCARCEQLQRAVQKLEEE